MELIITRPNKQIFRRGSEIVKLFASGVPAEDVLEEAFNQTLAQQAGLPVPRLHEVTKINEQWAVISDYIEGETLQWHMEREPARLREWLALLVRLQQQVHAASAPRLRQQREKLQRRISQSGLDATTRYELHIRLDAMPAHLKICHGDFVPSNIILRGGEAYIIDWAHVTQGNATADAANTYITLQKQGDAQLAAAYLALYCDMSDTARQYVDKWLPIVAAARLARCNEDDRAFYKAFCEGVV